MENSIKKSNFMSAYHAARQTLLGMRWRLRLWVILGVVVGNIVKWWLIAEYSLPRSEAYFFATFAVILVGFIAVLTMTFSSRNHIR